MSRYRRLKRGRRVDATGRSIGGDPYVNLTYSMLLSPAWLSLSGGAVKLWLLLRTRFNGGNNGRLILSLEEAAHLLRMGKATVFKAFAELEAKGFAVCIRRGQWYGRRASEWAVTDKGVDGSPASFAWRRWNSDAAVPAATGKT